MQTFLEDIANELLAQGGNDFSQTCIVLPNRRAGVFLRDAISRQSQKAIWAPNIISIEDFVFELSPFVKADQTTLLFAFYEVYKQKAKDPQTIELFASWAPVFLSDINELDLNLLDAQDVFAQLHSIERIKKWNPENGTATDFQDKHLKFVEQFYPFYRELIETLSKKGLAYQGMAFRSVVDNLNEVISNSKWESVWFAGFNALTVAEEQLISTWQSSEKCKVFWDMDTYYTDNPLHEAGHYLRKYQSGKSTLKLHSDLNWKAERLASEKKEIHLIATQRSIAQAKTAGSILKERLGKGQSTLTNTAVVLNDEQLLLPLLSSLPEELSGVNITMGYGLRHSQSAVFVDHLFALHANYSSSGNRFYHQHVAAIEEDSFFKLIQKQKADKRETRIYYSAEQLQLSKLHAVIFSADWDSINGFLAQLKKLIELVGKHLDDESLEREFLFLMDKLAQRLSDLTSDYRSIDSLKTLHTFWRQLLRNQQLDFVGEPLTGLQIMGMLETRNLDFEEVIMLGVNEGNLPSTSHASSYFTFDVRRAYGLPCQNERDAVTAYHFYRLLQRAKRVYLIYDEDTDSFGGGEVSRFVKQLELESGDNIEIKSYNLDQHIPESGLVPPISIEKGEAERQKLIEKASGGFSPSALNTFRNCSLKYYFRYVAGIQEPDQFQEDIDAAKLGTAIHKTLEKLYEPFVGRALNASELTGRKSLIRELLLTFFQDALQTKEALTGSDLLTFEVGVGYINRVIDHDLSALKSGEVITILGLEQKLSGRVSIDKNGNRLEANLKGDADRVDRLTDGTIRAIDYKTGSFNKNFAIKSEADFADPKTDIAFQLLTYLYMLSKQKKTANIEPLAYFLRASEIPRNVTVSIGKKPITEEALVEFAEGQIRGAIEALMDFSQPFSQTEDAKRCEYCEFNSVCQR